MDCKRIIVAIDGYSSSGKSTMARRLAAAAGYRYIDSGAMYRAVTLKAMRLGYVSADRIDADAICAMMDDTSVDFRPSADGQITLLDVMDGRDIGTTVFPNAELKVFVDAGPETRARRRFKELIDKGENTTYEAVLANVTERDHIDRTRAESPLRCADDAVRFDNSDMTLAQQDEMLMRLFDEAVKRHVD